MTKPQFKIKKIRGKRPKEGLPNFILEQDNWNDFSFNTQYHLSYNNVDSSGRSEATLIGPVKILKIGQTEQDGLLVNTDFGIVPLAVEIQ